MSSFLCCARHVLDTSRSNTARFTAHAFNLVRYHPRWRQRRSASVAPPHQQFSQRSKQSSAQRAASERRQKMSHQFRGSKYDKLPDPALYIRLIRRTTAPSKSKGPAFELKVTHRKRAPPYIALSYCWGPADVEPQQILLQGAALPIRRNLHSVLVAGCIEDDAWA